MTPPEVAGLVLAGGRSSRMGRDKALLRVGGETLAQRQIRLLQRLGIREVFLSRPAGEVAFPDDTLLDDAPLDDTPPDAAIDVTIVRDAAAGQGPLAGIVAGLEEAEDRALLVLAVDMPGVTERFLEGLLVAADLDAGVGAAPRVGDRWEPLCALYPPGVLDEARRHLAGDRRSPSGLLDALLATGRIRPVEVDPAEAALLRSWNTPEDPNLPG
jgi:molybdenum cofactor guanylyltransferase